MNKRLVSVFCLSVLLVFGAFTSNAQDAFRGIIPFVTTKGEAEKKLGKRDQYGRYELDEGTVSIHYLEKECEKSAINCSCFVPVGTVLKVSVLPTSERKIEDLELDPKEWESGEVKGHIHGLTHYSNRKTGVTYYVQEGVIGHIIYGIDDETCEKLSQKATQRLVEPFAHHSPKQKPKRRTLTRTRRLRRQTR